VSQPQPAGDEPVASGGHADCSEALARLFEFLDAEIDELDGDRIRQHLADCDGCLHEYDIEDLLKALVRRSCHEVAPVELHVRIRQQLVVLRERLDP
jgi:anti-sigma factor (TIGR02949 family)